MPVNRIGPEDLGLRGRLRVADYRPRTTRRRITVADVRTRGVQRAEPSQAGRKVSGDWLSAVLGMDKETTSALAGQEVFVEEEAWFAVQASLNPSLRGRSVRRRIARRRAEIWPEESVDLPLVEAEVAVNAGESPITPRPCACWTVTWASARFVDADNGNDSNSGSFDVVAVGATWRLAIKPWRTLCQVEGWLNGLVVSGVCVRGAKVFLRRGRAWSGMEESGKRAASPCAGSSTTTPAYWEDQLYQNSTTGDSAALTVVGFKGTEDHPLVISAYGPEGTTPLGSTDGGPLDDRPIIDGCSERSTGALYKAAEIGLLFYDCCHVHVSDLRVRGFMAAIQVRGGSKDHLYENVKVYDNSRWGFHIGVTDADVSVTPAAIDSLIAAGLYPADIIVTQCQAESNGYDTKGADIELGFLATNCTISENDLWGGGASGLNHPTVRGIDGIVSQGGSSGHVIEKNRIYGHSAWCRTSSGETIVQKDYAACGGTGTWTIIQSCGSTNYGLGSCGNYTTEYGFHVCYQAAPSGDPSAFGEDGIDLKGVYQRTPDARKETIVCDNVIWGHTSHSFTGITVNDGSQDIYVYRNRIFQNSVGISVTNSESGGWYQAAEGRYGPATSRVYIYRNLVYMNEEFGLHVESGPVTVTGGLSDIRRRVTEVYIVNNTIAHNLWTGVFVENSTGGTSRAMDVEGVYLYNNLIARNGINGTSEDQSRQVTWSATVALTDSSLFGSDYNCYLGWDGVRDSVLRWGTDDKSVRMASALDPIGGWNIEGQGLQVDQLTDLDFYGYSELLLAEGSIPNTDLQNVVKHSSARTAEAFDYDMGWASECLRKGKPAVGVNQPDQPADIAQSEDIDGEPVFAASPTIGAFEGPR